MERLVLSWLPGLRRIWWQLLLVAALIMLFAQHFDVPLHLSVLLALNGIAFWLWRWWQQLWQFGSHIRFFKTRLGKQVILRYAPELDGAIDFEQYAQLWEQALTDFTQRFGFPLKRRLAVFLFPTMSEISRLFSKRMGASALVHGDAVVVAADTLQADVNPEETIRHELTHLFSAYWGELEPPLKAEGLATWLQGSIFGKPVESQALAYLLSDRCIPLVAMLPSHAFYSSGWYAYALAGSFTGFLIRRFGWDTYRQFFRRANAKNFPTAFEKNFGLSLMAAEREWRNELLARRAEFEPELSTLVQERRLEASYNAWHFLRYLEECEAALRAGNTSWHILWYAAAVHVYLGNYGQAIALLEQIVQRKDADLHPYRVNAWRQLGNLYDLLGQREKAVQAYQQALREPDWWDAEGSAHKLVREHLQRPFTEKELMRSFRRRFRQA